MFPIMMEDSSTWCISAWNDNGWPAVVSDPSKVHRQEHFGGLGWAMTKKVWERDLKHYSYVVCIPYLDTSKGTNGLEISRN